MYKVLILDEDRGVRYMLRRFPWSRYGFEISDEAAGGYEALAKLDRKWVDLVITDIRMPDMNGVEFLEAVNARKEHPCLILLSTYNDFEYAQQGIGLGVFDYMTKPFSELAFGQTLQRAGIYLQKMHLQEGSHQADAREALPGFRENELRALLLAGNPAFLTKAARAAESLQKLEPAQREAALQALLERLYQALDRSFPWVRNIEAEKGCAPADEKSDFMTQIQALFELVGKYEIADEKSLLRSLCMLVQQNIEADLSLHFIASELNISSDYAGRLFKRKTGINFVSFVTRMKMERGKELLERGQFKNYEISARLGYSNPDYFRQLFKAYTGMTPTEYRNVYRHRIFR